MSEKKKLGSIGYIVGYDGQIPGGDVPKGSFVLPIGGTTEVATFHDDEQSALSELGGRTTLEQRSLGGMKTYVLKVHKVKLSWFPFAAEHIGYRKVKGVAA